MNITLEDIAGHLNASQSVADFFVASRTSIARVTAEANARPQYRVAIVGVADRRTPAGRVYPRSEWAKAVSRANSDQCPHGTLGGAVDHAGPLVGGNMRDRCIRWHSLAIDADGVVTGQFEIVVTHSAGRNVMAWIEAGGALGFAPHGNAKTRPPTADERQRYGLKPDDEDAVVVEAFELVGIDVVDPMMDAVPVVTSTTESFHRCLMELMYGDVGDDE